MAKSSSSSKLLSAERQRLLNTATDPEKTVGGRYETETETETEGEGIVREGDEPNQTPNLNLNPSPTMMSVIPSEMGGVDSGVSLLLRQRKDLRYSEARGVGGGRRAIPPRRRKLWGHLGGISDLCASLLITAWVRYQLAKGYEYRIRRRVIEESRPDAPATETVTTVVEEEEEEDSDDESISGGGGDPGEAVVAATDSNATTDPKKNGTSVREENAASIVDGSSSSLSGAAADSTLPASAAATSAARRPSVATRSTVATTYDACRREDERGDFDDVPRMKIAVSEEVQVGIFPIIPLSCDSGGYPKFVGTADCFLGKDLKGTIKTATMTLRDLMDCCCASAPRTEDIF